MDGIIGEGQRGRGDRANGSRLGGDDRVCAIRQRGGREAPSATFTHGRGAKDGSALGQRHDRFGIARAGQRVDVGDFIRVRAAAVGAQSHCHACRGRVVGEAQRGCADIAGGVRLAGHDRVRAIQ